MELVYKWVMQIVTVVAFIVIIEIILPAGTIKKVINMVMGFILIIAIINPILQIINTNLDIGLFITSAEERMDEYGRQSDAGLLQEEQSRQLVEVYRNKVIENIRLTAASFTGVDRSNIHADVVLEEDIASSNFGRIRQIFVKLVLNASKQGGKSIVIDRISSSETRKTEGEEGDDNKTETGSVDNGDVERLAVKLCSLYELKRENVSISLEEGDDIGQKVQESD